MKVVFTPTHYSVSGGVSAYDANNACNGVDNENPAYINLSGTAGEFTIDKFRLKGGTWNQYYEEYFYGRSQEWYIKSIVLRVKYGTEEETKPSTASWVSTFRIGAVTFPESGVETKVITGGPDMYDANLYNDDEWAYFCTRGDMSPYVKFKVPAESGKRILVYGAEVEVEYEDCVPITVANFSSAAVTVNIYQPGTMIGRGYKSGMSRDYIYPETIFAPIGGVVYVDCQDPVPTILYANDENISNRREPSGTGAKYRYVIEGPTDFVSLSGGMWHNRIVATAYTKKNGTWSPISDSRTVIDVNEKYHKG